MILLTVAVYLSGGLLFGLAFVAKGVSQVDSATRGTSVTFRLLILPGTMALWPFLARKWWATCKEGVNR